MSPDDVEAMTRDQVRDRLPEGHRLVVSLRADDLAAEDDPAIADVVASTDGGVLVVGVAYDVGTESAAHGQTCPECDRQDAVLLGPSDDHVAADVRGRAQLYQCRHCGSAWDA
jgi:hypothetical protein